MCSLSEIKPYGELTFGINHTSCQWMAAPLRAHIFIWNERERQTDRHTERERERQTYRETDTVDSQKSNKKTNVETLKQIKTRKKNMNETKLRKYQ